MMDAIISFLSAAGSGGIIGGVVTSFFQAWLAQRTAFNERQFQEKKKHMSVFLKLCIDLTLHVLMQTAKIQDTGIKGASLLPHRL
jgi:hypothetical protein